MRAAFIIRLCDATSVPGETECRAAIGSQGRDCKLCDRDDCYRQGWNARAVTADNKRLVDEKTAAYLRDKSREVSQ